jgi:two-component system response regulator PilR (NtrC family)
MSTETRLLVVDDEPDLRTLYELTLLREGYAVDSAGSVEEAWALLTAGAYAAVITDVRLPDGTGLDLLRRMDAAGRAEKGIVITAYGSAENAVEALKAGAYDYLTKPVDLRQFRSVVAAAVGRLAGAEPAAATVAAARSAGPRPARGGAQGAERGADGSASDAADPALARLVGDSRAMQQVRALVRKVARSMAPVLVRGESGTGKELVARAIHEVSPRAARPFVAVNCGAIPESLLEAEFFGWRKGAFTGAQEDRAGFFAAAQGGTLFLDEIGDLPLAMQSKLLRAIQERAVRPLGTTQEQPVDVRLVSATHKDLAAAVAAQTFRQDLFYRLNVIQIEVPPLRSRLEDLPAIAAALLQRIAHDAGVAPPPDLSSAALQLLLRHGFAGNVRELENLLHRAVALSAGSTLEADDLGLPPAALDDGLAAAASDEPADPVWQETAGAPLAGAVELPHNLAQHLDRVEREILEAALDRHRYNRTAAGASLGLTLRQMRYRMARLGIVGDGSDSGPGEL